MVQARSMAQEAATWYQSNLNEHLCHSDNVRTYLRSVVIAVTLNVLHSKENLIRSEGRLTSGIKTSRGSEIEVNNDTKKDINGDSWRAYLYQGSDQSEFLNVRARQEVRIEKLSRRSRARMAAFLAGCTLAVPDEPLNLDMQGQRKPVINNAESLQRGESDLMASALSGFDAPTSKPSSPLKGKRERYPQMEWDILAPKLELYVKNLVMVRTKGEECVLHRYSTRTLRNHIRLLVAAFVSTVGCVRSLGPTLVQLIQCWTREQLAMDVLGDDLKALIRRVASEYEHQISFASLAFLSSPEGSIETHLMPLLFSYANFLHNEKEQIIADCELERSLAISLDKDMRHMFKNIEFHSILHLLEVCHEHRTKLQNIKIPPVEEKCSKEPIDPKKLQQAFRDMRRETIVVNGHVLPPVRSRRELVHLLTEALNSRFVSPQNVCKRNARPARKGNLTPIPTICSDSSLDSMDGDSGSEFVSSGNEGDTDGSLPKYRREGCTGSRKTRKRSFNLDTINFMTKRLLVAACRTGIGGDAYFVV